MLGGMIAITMHSFMPIPLAIVVAVLITMVVGALIEMVFIRWLESPSVLRMIIITIGIPYFIGNEVTSVSIFGARISPQVLWVIAVCSFVVVGLSLFFKFTSLGREMRACAANRRAAILCGINAKNMVTLSFVLSAGIGAVAGCVMSPITYSDYSMGPNLAIKGFTVAILGGLGNSLAAVAAGLLLGIIEAFSISVLPLAFQDAIATSILLLILFIRPHGLFGSSEAASLKEF
jgi:branched-chain amino acid transport system permease protein